MPNPFLEGSPHNQMTRISEFASEFHTLDREHVNPLPWMTITTDEAINCLEAAFFDSCVATQASVIKALTLLRVFDNYPKQRINDFIIRANSDTQAHYISEAISCLKKVNTID